MLLNYSEYLLKIALRDLRCFPSYVFAEININVSYVILRNCALFCSTFGANGILVTLLHSIIVLPMLAAHEN